MIDKLEPNFSHVFNGIVWNTVASSDEKVLLVEVRKPEEKRVLFSAFNYETNLFLWRDRQLEEPWWVNASAIVQGIVLFTIYLDTNNPDKKGILAYSLEELELVWWNNDFSISAVSDNIVHGFSEKYGRREVVLDLNTGKTLQSPHIHGEIPEGSLRPQQFFEGHSYFDSVKIFFSQKFNLSPITALEYLEFDSLIFVSC